MSRLSKQYIYLRLNQSSCDLYHAYNTHNFWRYVYDIKRFTCLVKIEYISVKKNCGKNAPICVWSFM